MDGAGEACVLTDSGELLGPKVGCGPAPPGTPYSEPPGPRSSGMLGHDRLSKLWAGLAQVGKLKEHATPVKGSGDIKNVAAISAGNDEAIGQMIADALDKVGADGVLAIESSNSLETTVGVDRPID